MARKKLKRPPNEPPPKRKQYAAKILSGILCITFGFCLNWDVAAPADIPDWSNEGPLIDIGSEGPWASIYVWCSVMENGKFTLSLSAGQYLDEPVRVWVTVVDCFYPFRWEIGDGGIDNVVLYRADGDEGTTSDYPIERTFISQKTGRMRGESIGYLSDLLHFEIFTAIITPGEEACEIAFQMDPEHAEYHINGDIIIRMPYIANDRRLPIYNMSVGDLGAIIESGNYNMLPYFSNRMIDGAVLYESALEISGDYFSEYMLQSNYVVASIQPNPVQLFPSCSWRERLQWIPYIVFHDWSHDELDLILKWVSGILITIGSGLIVLPLSDWIQPIEKGKK